eukprot:TRINITY_DN884_c1_g1_i1.p1 TRINITY_DN884_c1_g1~~TRINITY_DN884_c1_g1_i1.p1  ORF type:complete len:1029 (-),score=138.66 TRINITY_DN884_c1_g1_i1:5102-8188(-)
MLKCNDEQFNRIFPFFIRINKDFLVDSIGNTMEKLYPESKGRPFDESFEIVRPHVSDLSFSVIQSLTKELVVIECKNSQQTILKGQLEWFDDLEIILFIGTPWFDSIEKVIGNNLSINDFAIHDSTIDLLHLLKTQEITTEDLKELLATVNKQKNKLKTAAKEIRDIALFPTQNPDPVIRIDAEGKILRQNPAAEALDCFEFEGENYSANEFWKFIAGKVEEDNEQFTVEAYSKGEIYSFIIRGIKGLNYYNIYGRQISEQKRNEAKLEILSSIAAQNAHGVVIADKHGRIEWVNESFEKMTGYTLDELIGQKPGHLLQGPDSDPETILYLSNQIKKGEPFVCEILNYNKLKKPYWLRIQGQALYDENGNVSKYFAIEEDITHFKEIQHQQEESEQKYRDVIENSLALITTHDLDGKLLTVNPMVGRTYGYDDHEMIGRCLSEFIPEEERELFHGRYLEKIKSEKQASGIIQVESKSGKVIYTLYNNFLKEEFGKEPYVIGFGVDITERIKAEKELKVAKKATEDLAEAKQNFLANMSHEIRTPMNAIIGMSNQLTKTTLTEQQKFYLDTIHTAAENLLVIINDILDLSKIEAGKLNIENIAFEPRNVIERAIQVLMHKAEEKGIELNNSFFDDKLSEVLIGDPYRLNQILLNLISNAIKFTEKGKVDVAFELIENKKKSQVIRISVIDTGIGMSESFVKKLFYQFNQEDVSISRKYGGTGLGMSITHSLLRLMGGTIHVDSKKDEGTSVRIELDLLKGSRDALSKQEVVSIDTNKLKGRKILIVDDNVMNRLLASIILQNFQAEIVEADNGKHAMEKIESENPEVVLMDIQMPVLNGIQTTQLLRQKGCEIPVIALTANAIKGEDKKCIEAGMNDYLAKPYSENQLLQTLVKWLDDDVQNTSREYQEYEILDEKSSSDLYNLDGLKQISRGNRSFVKKMIKMFCDLTPAIVEGMLSAYRENEFTKMGNLAHKLKPSVDNLRINSIKDDVRFVERVGKEGRDDAEISDKLVKIDKTIEEVILKLQEEN